MSIRHFLIFGILAIAGCGFKKPTPPSSGIEPRQEPQRQEPEREVKREDLAVSHASIEWIDKKTNKTQKNERILISTSEGFETQEPFFLPNATPETLQANLEDVYTGTPGKLEIEPFFTNRSGTKIPNPEVKIIKEKPLIVRLTGLPRGDHAVDESYILKLLLRDESNHRNQQQVKIVFAPLPTKLRVNMLSRELYLQQIRPTHRQAIASNALANRYLLGGISIQGSDTYPKRVLIPKAAITGIVKRIYENHNWGHTATFDDKGRHQGDICLQKDDFTAGRDRIAFVARLIWVESDTDFNTALKSDLRDDIWYTLRPGRRIYLGLFGDQPSTNLWNMGNRKAQRRVMESCDSHYSADNRVWNSIKVTAMQGIEDKSKGITTDVLSFFFKSPDLADEFYQSDSVSIKITEKCD